ncbi:MAG: hypothetical protein KIT17_20010, partial [Rubrivivax sp.]|nr:hypothetical protein [Rubrivivax sp.]
LARRLGAAMLLARVVPGLRLATYTACGFLRIAFLPFGAWVVAATSAWTLGLFALGGTAGRALASSLGLPLPLAVALPIVAVALVLVVLPKLVQGEGARGATHADLDRRRPRREPAEGTPR